MSPRFAVLRNAVLVAAVCSAAVLATMPQAARSQEVDRVRVVQLVVDSLHPDQVTQEDTPFLFQLKNEATWYEQHRSVMAAETLPNHVAMATGAYPATNGIPGNDGRATVGDTEPADPDLGQPDLLESASFTTAIETACPELHTVTVFSKEYVYRIFEGEADADFPQPVFNIPKSGHAPDASTVGFIVQEIGQNDPDYLFANLGDVDRAGHIDATGFSGIPSIQLAALHQTDMLIAGLVQELQQRGLWEDTVLVVNSDHSMDWSIPGDPSAEIDVGAALEADDRTAGKLFVSPNGGAALVYLNDPDAPDAAETLVAARAIVDGLEGIDEALYREPNPLDPGYDLRSVHPAWRNWTPRIGEIFATASPGHKFVAGPEEQAIPGNHGHTITRHATLMITGGWDGLAEPSSIAPSGEVNVADDTEQLPEQSEQVDLAPTYGWLLGVPDPGLAATGTPQWEGRVLEEAFTRQPDPVCVAAAGDDAEPAPEPSPTPTPSSTGGDSSAGDDSSLPATGGGIALAGILVLAAGLARRRFG